MRPTLYLHGFLSHPNSAKPKLLREAHEKIGKPFIAPELYMSPEEVAAFLSKLIKEDLEGGPVDVIGSSLGGFYAAWAKEHLPVVKAVLLNPALGNWGKVASTSPGCMGINSLTASRPKASSSRRINSINSTVSWLPMLNTRHGAGLVPG